MQCKEVQFVLDAGSLAPMPETVRAPSAGRSTRQSFVEHCFRSP